MAITSAICSSFKQELLQGKHSLDTSGNGGDSFKLAMYTSSASLGAATTAYSSITRNFRKWIQCWWSSVD